MKIIIANWKMNGTMADKDQMTKALKKLKTNHNIVLCLPFTLLYGNNSGITLGAQNISQHPNGAYTGDISAEMVKEAGATYVLVGHSERRLYHNETNVTVKQKATAAIEHGLIPVICVGETYEEKHSGQTMSAVEKMLVESVPDSGNYIVAYEPRWAIGTNSLPTMQEIKDVHEMIAKILTNINHTDTPIIYGGSVDKTNSADIVALPHVDGLLIGRASLKPETFLPIIESID